MYRAIVCQTTFSLQSYPRGAKDTNILVLRE